jgi:hypothetical protein
MDGICDSRVCEIPTGLWWGKPKERDGLEDLRVDGKIILKRI